MAKKKGKGGLVVGIVLGVLVLAGGGFGVMVAMGKVPFLAKKGAKPPIGYGDGQQPPSGYGEGKEPPKDALATTEPKAAAKKDGDKAGDKKKPAAPVQPPPDPVKGAKKIAAVWNSMETTNLVKLANAYPEAELPLVLTKMDTDKAAELLAGLAPDKAAKLSLAMAKIAGAPVKVQGP